MKRKTDAIHKETMERVIAVKTENERLEYRILEMAAMQEVLTDDLFKIDCPDLVDEPSVRPVHLSSSSLARQASRRFSRTSLDSFSGIVSPRLARSKEGSRKGRGLLSLIRSKTTRTDLSDHSSEWSTLERQRSEMRSSVDSVHFGRMDSAAPDLNRSLSRYFSHRSSERDDLCGKSSLNLSGRQKSERDVGTSLSRLLSEKEDTASVRSLSRQRSTSKKRLWNERVLETKQMLEKETSTIQDMLRSRSVYNESLARMERELDIELQMRDEELRLASERTRRRSVKTFGSTPEVRAALELKNPDSRPPAASSFFIPESRIVRTGSETPVI